MLTRTFIEMPSRSKRVVALACLLATGMGFYYFVVFLPKAHAVRASQDLDRGYDYGCDFYQIWLTSRELLLHRANPYTAEMTSRIQIGVFGRVIDPQRPGDPRLYLASFPYPLYTDLLVAPLALLSFPMVQIMGSVLSPALVVVSIFLWLRVLDLRLQPSGLVALFVLTLTSYPILQGIYALQVTLVVAALLAGSVAALVKGHLGWAGALLGIASVKPQLMLLPTLFLALWAASDTRGRKAFLLSFIGTITFLFVVSEAVLPGWSATWIRALFEYRQYVDPPLSQLIFGPALGNLLALSLIVTAAILIFRARQARTGSPQFATTLVFLLAITVPLIPTSIAVYDHILLVPAVLWLILRKDQILHGGKGLRILGYLVSAAISWQWIAATGVGLCCLLFPDIGNTAWMLLPLRTAPSVPFIVIALCLLLNWKTRERAVLGQAEV